MDPLRLRNSLHKRREELKVRLDRVVHDSRHASGLEPNLEEQSIELENDDVLANLNLSIRAELLQIEKTLERLDNGRYGLCESCHKPIPAKRLESLPYATHCISCES